VKQQSGKTIRSPYVWAFTAYFTEGFPYTVIRTVSTFFFRDRGVSLKSIGLTSLFGLAWSLKPLIGPLADRFGTKRSWLLWMQAILCCIMLCTAFFSSFDGGIHVIAVLFFFGSFFAATNDIAIDGYYMEALDSKSQELYIGYRVMAYRVAMIAGTGIVATIGTKAGWFRAFLFAAVLFGLFFIYNLFFLPRVEKEVRPMYLLFKSLLKPRILLIGACISICIAMIRYGYTSGGWQSIPGTAPLLQKTDFTHIITTLLFLALIGLLLFRKKLFAVMTKNPDTFYSKAFLSFLDRDKIGVIIICIIFLRTGEYMLSTLESSFFHDLGIKVHFGWIRSFVGLPCSILGALAGGAMIAKASLKKVMWPFLFLQNCTNLVYMALAFSLSHVLLVNTGAQVPAPVGAVKLLSVVLVHGFDQFSGGLGSAVLTALLLKLCNPEYKAAHFAIGTGLMTLSGVFVGIIGGYLCDWLGYGYFFGISFLFSLPGMAAILFLPDAIYYNTKSAYK